MEVRRPSVFIGSSRESLNYVVAVQEALSRYAEVTPWSAGTFNVLNYTMEDLEVQLDQNDYAVFICSPDDIIEIRGTKYFTSRDNTLFEMGLFWGKLRRGRVFFIIPNKINNKVANTDISGFHLLSDLVGINPLIYEVRETPNYPAAVNVACSKIVQKMTEQGLFVDPIRLLQQEKTRVEELKLRQKVRDSVANFALKLTKELIKNNNTKIYEYLTDSLRSVYEILPECSLDGVGLWKKEGNDGLRHAAGKVGEVDFYSINSNEGKTEDADDRILVIDTLLNGEETILQTKDHLFKTYLICYPIGKELVLTVTISAPNDWEEDIRYHIIANEELIKTINYLFGGALK